ncbi:MAG: pyridoxal phosphate-dependent aminotransferase [Bacteroidota bacterium]
MSDYSIPEGSLISYFSNKVKLYGGINFAQGIPGYSPPAELLDSLKKCIDLNIHQYAPGKGNSLLLDLIAENYCNYSIKRNSVLITQGATEAIALIYIYLSQQFRNFTVLSFDPVYESYNNLPKIFNNKFIPFKLSDLSVIDFENLENVISRNNVKLLLLSSPGNPYGKVYRKSELQNLFNLAEKHDFYILFDAVYKDLYFKEKPFLPIENLNKRVFYVNSFSKMLSITGWRIGYLMCNEYHMRKIESIHDYIGLCAPSLLQEAIAHYLNENQYGRDYLINLRKKLKNSFDIFSDALVQLDFSIPEISGGYFIWAKLPEKYEDCFKFSLDLYEKQKVATIPGIHFTEEGNKFVRFNIAREIDEIEKGIDALTKFIIS